MSTSHAASVVTGSRPRLNDPPHSVGARQHLRAAGRSSALGGYDVLIDAEASVLKDSSAWGSVTTTR